MQKTENNEKYLVQLDPETNELLKTKIKSTAADYYGNSVAVVNIQNPAFQRFHSLLAFHFRQSPFSTI